MKKLILLSVLALVPASAVYAQASLDEEINAELDRMYKARELKGLSAAGSPSVTVNVQTSPTQNQVVDQNSRQATGQTTNTVQKAPVTVIEAAPLTESRAEAIRRLRQEEEVKTEVKLAEKLEMLRIEDERRRQEDLIKSGTKERVNVNVNSPSQLTIQNSNIDQTAIGNKVEVNQTAAQDTKAQETQATQVDSPKAVITQPAAQVQAVEAPQVVVTPVHAAGTAAVVVTPLPVDHTAAVIVKTDETVVAFVNRNYMSASIGMGEYLDADNVRGEYALGMAFGQRNKDFAFEGFFQYGNYQIEQFDSGPYGFNPYYPRITEMDQYSFGGALKYVFLTGSVKPYVGGLAQYTYRYFSDIQLGFPNNDASSHAIDLGGVVGLDVDVTRTFAIGGEFKFIGNVYSRTENTGLQPRFSSQPGSCQPGCGAGVPGTPIEEMTNMFFNIVTRFYF